MPYRLASRIRTLIALAATSVFGLVWLTVAPAHATTNTVVSLTFDDGSASQYSTLSMLSAHGMNGTYYVNSALLGSSSYYMTWSQVHDLYNAGNEIGGHTLHHKNLTTLSTAAATTEVCDDRTNLINAGLTPVTSFAYPDAASNSSVEQIVQSCGYTSARTVGNINSITVCADCPYAETIPPRDPFYLRTPEPATSTTTLSDLETYVTNAETHGGGWLILVFHGICDNSCTSTNSFSPSLFTAFLDWLQPRSANGTVVQTVGQVVNGPAPPPGPDTTPPTTTISCNSATCSSGWYRTSPVTVSLSATDTGGSGVATTSYTLDGTDPRTSPSAVAYTGPFSVSQTTTVTFASTDVAGNVEAPKAQLIQIDTAAPTVSITAPADGSSYKRGTKVVVSASATDSGTGPGAPSGVARVVFLLDGTTTLATATASPYQFTWNTRKTFVGQHTLTAVSTDVAGNSATSAPITVNITK
jgi:peptidoglycan/xylan/chitin deacetylase (PgdA/CDA1 family)